MGNSDVNKLDHGRHSRLGQVLEDVAVVAASRKMPVNHIYYPGHVANGFQAPNPSQARLPRCQGEWRIW